MSAPDLMLDLETLATTVGAFIVQIAAVPFDLDGDHQCYGDRESTFNYHVNATSQRSRHIDLDTVVWWQDQDYEARKRVFRPRRRLSLEQVLGEFSRYYRDLGHPRIWSNGPEFDGAILKHAYEEIGEPVPWHHRSVRCFRTACDIGIRQRHQHRRPISEDAVLHDAASDCVEQIKDLMWHLYDIADLPHRPMAR